MGDEVGEGPHLVLGVHASVVGDGLVVRVRVLLLLYCALQSATFTELLNEPLLRIPWRLGINSAGRL